jgi:hypothetical protein
VLSDEGDALREKLKNLIAKGKKQIVVNMKLIKSVDSRLVPAGRRMILVCRVLWNWRGPI